MVGHVSAPLEGIRVLDLTRLLPGPYCGAVLAGMGAEVVKVEAPGAGDPARAMVPGALFELLNRGKRSITLNLAHPEGAALLRRLAGEADVLLEGFRPGTMERFGVGPEALREVNPRLVYCAISGYGQTGPLARRSGHDLDYAALSGVLGLTADDAGRPVIPGTQLADLAGGALPALVQVLAALFRRERTGEGATLDVSMQEGLLALQPIPAAYLLEGEAPGVGERYFLTGTLPCYRVYPCAEGSGYVALAALEPKFWASFCAAVERPDLLGRHEDPAAVREVEAIFVQRTRDEWAERLAEADCCAEPVLSLREALGHPHVRERAGAAPLPSPAGALGAGELSPAPRLGEHTAPVLGDLGLAGDEIRNLERTGAI